MNEDSVSGPLFEPTISCYWKSVHNRPGGHYNTFRLSCVDDGIAAIRAIFPDGKANSLNVILFGTSGCHGHYGSVEDIDSMLKTGDGDTLTFLIIHTRLCTLRYGNCRPSIEDIEYLKGLRESSFVAMRTLGVDGHDAMNEVVRAGQEEKLRWMARQALIEAKRAEANGECCIPSEQDPGFDLHTGHCWAAKVIQNAKELGIQE